MTTVEAASALLAEIENLVATVDLDGCTVDLYRVTAGEPAAPLSSCSTVSVWATSYFNAATSLFHEDNACVITRGIALSWRLDLCFTETEKDRPAEAHLEDATCLYALADAIWCGIIQRAGEIFDLNCKDFQVDPLTVNPASGAMYSVTSGVRLQLDCAEVPTS